MSAPTGLAAKWFRPFAERSAAALGSPRAFMFAVGLIVVWALLGPYFRFSAKWQMVIYLFISVTTFLMVFLVQSTQAHDTRAVHLKLDELLRAVHEARTGLVGLERLPDERLDQLTEEFKEIAVQEQEGVLAGDTAPGDEVPDERYDGDHQQQMNQGAADMKDHKSQ